MKIAVEPVASATESFVIELRPIRGEEYKSPDILAGVLAADRQCMNLDLWVVDFPDSDSQ